MAKNILNRMAIAGLATLLFGSMQLGCARLEKLEKKSCIGTIEGKIINVTNSKLSIGEETMYDITIQTQNGEEKRVYLYSTDNLTEKIREINEEIIAEIDYCGAQGSVTDCRVHPPIEYPTHWGYWAIYDSDTKSIILKNPPSHSED